MEVQPELQQQQNCMKFKCIKYFKVYIECFYA